MFHQEIAQIVRFQAAQTSMYFLEKRYRGTTNNHLCYAMDIVGPVDEKNLAAALSQLMARHELLHAAVRKNKQGGFLQVLPLSAFSGENAVTLKVINARHVNPVPRAENLPDTLKSLRESVFLEQPFALDIGPLWRFALIKYAENKNQLAMVFNHLIVDGKSVNIIINELSYFYNAILQKTNNVALPTLPSLTNLNLTLSKEEEQRRLDFWKIELNQLNLVNLPTDHPQQSFKFRGKRVRFALNHELLNQLADQEIANKFLLTCLYVVLHQYSGGETDICVGVTSGKRLRNELSGLVGAFFNSVPLRLKWIDKNITFNQLLTLLEQTQRRALKNQLSLDVVVTEALSTTTKSMLNIGAPFNVMLVYNDEKTRLQFAGTTADYPVDIDLSRSKLNNFAICVDCTGEGFIEYNTEIYNETSIRDFVGRFLKTVDAAAINPQCKITDISLLLEQEKVMIQQLNQTQATPHFSGFVHDYLHQIAERIRNSEIPDRTAICFHHENKETVTISYEELDRITTLMANYLIQLGVRPRMAVGICIRRSINLFIAMLAVLKTGAAFVTMETTAAEILAHKIKSANISLVLADPQTQSLFKGTVVNAINIEDKIINHEINHSSPVYQSPAITPADPAYYMYTSGTTGAKPEPKAVAGTHGGFANLVNALIDLNLQPDSIILSGAPPTFDAVLYDIAAALAARNGQIHLINDKQRYSPSVVEDVIRKFSINYAVFLPEFLNNLNPDLPSLNCIIITGAVINNEIIHIWLRANPNRRMFNGFGATEGGICSSFHRFLPGESSALIGKPITKVKMFVLNPENFSICPVGISGEIIIGGAGLALGYIGNPELTRAKFQYLVFDHERQKFIKCEADHPGAERFYFTGDFGCYHQTSNNTVEIKYLYRKDSLVKINGVAIELGATDAVLRAHPLIQDAAVILNNEKTALKGFVVPKPGSPAEDELRKELRIYLASTFLPSIAYPRTFAFLRALPLTPNGKVDTRALSSLPDPMVPVTARSVLQAQLITIWAKILGCTPDQIDTFKKWKELGGDSFKLANLEYALNKTFVPKEAKAAKAADRTRDAAKKQKRIGISILSVDMTIESLEIELQRLLTFFEAQQKKHFMKLPENVTVAGNRLIMFGDTETPQHSDTSQAGNQYGKTN